MTDPARGPTTEELRARVLAQHETDVELSRVKEAAAAALAPVDALTESLRRESHDCATEGCDAVRDYDGPRPEGRTFYDPARPPLDSEGAESQ